MLVAFLIATPAFASEITGTLSAGTGNTVSGTVATSSGGGISGTVVAPSSGGGGGGSSSGGSSSGGGSSGSVLGTTTSSVPGIPNTGAGGDAAETTLMLVASAIAALAGLGYLRYGVR
jgi:hypothetical protein